MRRKEAVFPILMFLLVPLLGNCTPSGNDGGMKILGAPTPIVENIVDNTGLGARPRVAIDKNGNAIVVWDDQDFNAWAERYEAGAGWGSAALLETSPEGVAGSPSVVMDSAGNTVAVWSQSDGVSASIWANRYELDSGWGTAVLLETSPWSAFYPAVEMDGPGNAMVGWGQGEDTDSGPVHGIFVNQYKVGVGWDVATPIATCDVYAYPPRMAIDDLGNATVVWQQGVTGSADETKGLCANRYNKDIGWGAAELISTISGNVENVQVGAYSNEDVMTVWSQYDGNNYSIYVNRYAAGIGWSTATLIETNNEDALNPQVVINNNGNATVIWNQSDGTHFSVWANRYEADTGWSTPVPIGITGGDASDLHVVGDDNGNDVAVWSQYDGNNYNIYVNRYKTGTGWGTATPIENSTNEARYPQIAMNGSGSLMAVWRQFDGAAYSIWANRVTDWE